MCVGYMCAQLCTVRKKTLDITLKYSVALVAHIRKQSENCVETLSTPILSLPHPALHPQAFATTFPVTCRPAWLLPVRLNLQLSQVSFLGS